MLHHINLTLRNILAGILMANESFLLKLPEKNILIVALLLYCFQWLILFLQQKYQISIAKS